MNRFKAISFATIIILAIFSVVFYTSSCNKDACVGVTCFNGAPCKNGSCSCPVGFTGISCAARAVTNIVYQNNTLSEVNISVTPNTSTGSTTISPGGTLLVSGNYGSAEIGSASTYSYSYSGQTITWNLSDTFPASGVNIVPLNAPPNYFFLYVINNNPSYSVTEAVVNYDLPTQTTVTGLSISSNTGYAYPVGYFRSAASCNVRLSEDTYYLWPIINFTLPDTINQSYTAIVN